MMTDSVNFPILESFLNNFLKSIIRTYDHYYHMTLGSFAPLAVQPGANGKFLNG